jgi:hypothetical protein
VRVVECTVGFQVVAQPADLPFLAPGTDTKVYVLRRDDAYRLAVSVQEAVDRERVERAAA